MNSIKDNTKMNTIFMNSENSKTSDLHRLLLNLTDKIVLRRKGKHIALTKINLEYQLQHGMKTLNYLIDHILYQIFQIILNIH